MGHDDSDALPGAQRSAVEDILERTCERGVRLTTVTAIRQDDARVLRVGDGTDSWIVKRSLLPPSHDDLFGPWGFVIEWVASETATRTGAHVAARFLGGDVEARVMVFEDLGTGLDVSQVLRGSDRALAERALDLMGTALGTLHSAALNSENEFQARWIALGGDRPLPGIVVGPRGLRATIADALNAIGARVSFDIDDVDALEQWAIGGGQSRTLVHGDPCLDNWILDRDGLPRLIDFQGAIYGPATLDSAYARAPFPTCWCVRRLPPDVIERFEANHRRALQAAIPRLADPDRYREELCMAAAWWFVTQLRWQLGHADGEDTSVPRRHLGFELIPIRTRVVLRLDSFVALSRRCGTLNTLADRAEALRAELVERWGEPATVALYPAFGGS